MFRIKRLYTFILQTFLPLFAMTFGICLFIVLMQFIWRVIDDLVGKGLEMSVLAEMFLYASLNLIPTALPLAILLASLMTFGNLGEQLELLAMKSAGISLIRIMRPLIVLIIFISIGAFFFQNNAMPVIQVKFYSLLYGIRQKSPELEIPEGSFYGDITDYNVYVRQKDKKTGGLKDMMIYDYSNNFNNARVIVADSGRLKVSEDKRFLILTLHNGESFENVGKGASSSTRGKTAVPYRRETFGTKEILIEIFNATFSPTDEAYLQNQHVGKNLVELQTSIDSMSVRLDSINSINARSIYDNSYKRNFIVHKGPEEEPEIKPFDQIYTTARKEGNELADLDFANIYAAQTASAKATILTRAKNSSENLRQDYFMKSATIGVEANKVRRHITEWHRKFTLSFSCIVFFFIGAPLGAIIRKGGLGVPVIISVILFIFYYIIDNMGYKMARDGVWAAWQGMWLSAAILTPMGIFLTYKAVNDSVILDADTYINALKNMFGKRANRKIEMKQVIIFTPDYASLLPRLEGLVAICKEFTEGHKRWINYFTFWRQGGRDHSVNALSTEMEKIVDELSNSDQILILNKLMDYPVMTGYNQINLKISPAVGTIIALFFPIGIPVYLLAVYKRKLLSQDVKTVERTSRELFDLVEHII